MHESRRLTFACFAENSEPVLHHLSCPQGQLIFFAEQRK
jgi:hypothetical protein